MVHVARREGVLGSVVAAHLGVVLAAVDFEKKVVGPGKEACGRLWLLEGFGDLVYLH